MSNKWITVWGCAIAKPARRVAEWIKDTTLRQQLQMTVSGTALKLHFSNLFALEDATISSATVALAGKDSAVKPETITNVTFGGKNSCTIGKGQGVISDEIPFVFSAGDVLVVNLYFADFVNVVTSYEAGDMGMSRWCCDGDHTHSEDLPLMTKTTADVTPLLNTVEALCDEECYTVVAFGDSITSQTWPDRLSRRVMDSGRQDVAIVRKAISGSRVLREYSCAVYRHYGTKGEARFEREVILPGVKKVFILQGINDIIHPGEEGNPFRPASDLPTAEELIAGLMYYVDTAHKNGIEVYLAPILPFKGWRTYSEDKEAIRHQVNNWIYNEAPVEGVLPFEEAVWDENDRLAMLADKDSGDHLHPGWRGAQAMADSIPDKFI